jgi:cytochrome c-type protein NapB
MAACLVLAFGAALSQDGAPVKTVPRLTGTPQPMALERVPALGRPVVDDVRRMRNYPEQPPVIPHSIEGYQLTVNTNRCMDCHKREFTEGSGAPMISVTHLQDREGQMLSDVTPRRYFCTACHVPAGRCAAAGAQPVPGRQRCRPEALEQDAKKWEPVFRRDPALNS